jgi:hypothetical protein
MDHYGRHDHVPDRHLAAGDRLSVKIDARFLVRLYPRDWRERYGDELMSLVGDRLNGKVAIDICRAAITERFSCRGNHMAVSSGQVGPTMIGGLVELFQDLKRDLIPWIPWRASALWGLALGATFVLAETYGLLAPTTDYAHRSQWFGAAGLAICFCAGLQPAWCRRDFGHGGIVALTAIVIGFAVAVVGDVAAVLVISQFRQLDLATQLYWAIEVPLPIMLMVGGSLGTLGAALAVGFRKVRHHA